MTSAYFEIARALAALGEQLRERTLRYDAAGRRISYLFNKAATLDFAGDEKETSWQSPREMLMISIWSRSSAG